MNLEDKVDVLLDQLAESRQSDHDLLLRTNQLITLHVMECKDRKTDNESRLRKLEKFAYIAFGILSVAQAIHIYAGYIPK